MLIPKLLNDNELGGNSQMDKGIGLHGNRRSYPFHSPMETGSRAFRIMISQSLMQRTENALTREAG